MRHYIKHISYNYTEQPFFLGGHMGFKVVFIGAGSIGFTRRLLNDLYSVPEFSDMDVAFTDINKNNLDMVYRLCKRDMEANKVKGRITATLNRREALKGANYVFSTVRVGGLEAFATDVEIPLSYGIDQCVGDTLCAGGIMYGQRNIPQILSFCKDISEVAAPDCLFMNYANPMAMNTWAALKYGHGVKTIGLCHGVQGGHHLISDALGLNKADVDIICAGINHQTWYISVKHKGKDMNPVLLDKIEKHTTYSKREKVRIDMMRRFGYFSTESNGHLSEYLSWYRKRPDEIKKWIDMGCWIDGETAGYLRICTESRNWFMSDFPNWMKEPPQEYLPQKRSKEHGSHIIEGIETGRTYRGHFNVRNNGCITNLPTDCIVEVPGYVDRNGINIPIVGDLPLGCAAVCNASVSVQRLAVEAAIHGDDMLLRQAMMMDPLTGAVCNPPEIWQMVDEMLVAGEAWLPQYKKAIASAKKRLAKGLTIKTNRANKGAARLKVKAVSQMRKDVVAARKKAGAADKANM